MPADRLLKPPPTDLPHYALTLDGRTLIMAPTIALGSVGHGWVMTAAELLNNNPHPTDD